MQTINLTIEKILMGNSNIRNPILVSYIAKGILPYKGLGSGIKRALDKWTDIEFINDQEGCLFTAIIRRREISVSGKMSGKMSGKIVSYIMENADITIPELAAVIGVSERTIERGCDFLKTGLLDGLRELRGRCEVVKGGIDDMTS